MRRWPGRVEVRKVRSTAVVALLLALACRETPGASTNTIAPADPQPASPVTTTFGSRPVIETAGSPTPSPLIASGTEIVTIEDGAIEMRPLLPRAHTAFRVNNETDVRHRLRFGNVAEIEVAPRGSAIVQMVLDRDAYALVCTVPGHQERVRFKTYAPGHPIRR